MIGIAHIVNPVKVDENNELFYQQPITYESMRRAKRDNVELWTTGYEEDPIIEGFQQAPGLTRSTLDTEYKPKRKLPYLKDILDNLYAASKADIFIQTNIDIGLMPHFYDAVMWMLDHGCDALIINRRTVPEYYNKVEDLPLLYSSYGKPHNGYDCFVFRREIYPKFELGEICMGTPWSESTITSNLIAYSRTCHVLKDAHLTFHTGNSLTWRNYIDYRKHNSEQFGKVAKKLMPQIAHSSIIHWLLWKLSKELQPDYLDDCHDVIKSLNTSKLMEYQSNMVSQ